MVDEEEASKSCHRKERLKLDLESWGSTKRPNLVRARKSDMTVDLKAKREPSPLKNVMVGGWGRTSQKDNLIIGRPIPQMRISKNYTAM